MDTVQSTEATGEAGGPRSTTVIGNSLREVDRANTRADAAEARVGELERAAYWTAGRVGEYERRIATLEADKRVSALKERQAGKDGRWVVAFCALTMILGFALILALVWATGPR